jgi:hypothetical protein
MVEWAIDCFDLLSKKIDYLQERVFTSFYQWSHTSAML